MAEQSPRSQFEDVPLEEARRMGRGPHMDPQLYQALRTRIQAPSHQAVRIAIPDGTSPATMKKRIRSVAAELNIPLTLRRVPGGLLFWRSSDDDIQQAQETASRLQTARQGRMRGRTRRRRGAPRRAGRPS